MPQDQLARATLDTLPFNIAVIDDDGMIRLTNRAWDEFGDGGDDTGSSYFGGIDPEDDDDATEAVKGLRAVLDGERDIFRLEYPCHSEDERQWFLMRVTPLPPGADAAAVVAHIDITDRKLAELRAQARAEQLEARRQALRHLVNRLTGLIQDVLQAVLLAETREEIEDTVCGRLTGVEPYTFAWVGEADLGREVIEGRASSGSGPEPGAIDMPLSLSDDPAVEAFESDGVQIYRDVADLSPDTVHRTVPAPGALIALPLSYGDASYGVLVVYATERATFDERERAVLEVVANVVATAIHAVESRRILTTDTIARLEVTLSGDGPFYRDLSAATGVDVTYGGAVTDDDGYHMFFTVVGAATETVRETAQGYDAVRSVSHLSAREGSDVFEFLVDEPPVLAALAEQGAAVTEIEVEGGVARVTIEVPTHVSARAVVERLQETYPSTNLVAYTEAERADETTAELLDGIEEALTGRQEAALRKAYIGGFFEWPRTISGEELAGSMDISPSTYHQHLRAAERKLLESLYERDT
jgi:PAS domain S-box-containing protein